MHQYTTNTSADVSLSAGVAKTILQLVTPSTRRAKLKEFAISMSSTVASDQPVLVELLVQTTGGTASAATPSADDPADPAALCTAQELFTAEPTSTTVRRQFRLTPIGGLIVYQFPEGDEVFVAVSSRLGLRVTAPQAQSGVRGHLTHQE